MKELGFTKKDMELIRYIQGDIPSDKRPFLSIAQRLGCSEEEVINRIREWIGQGIIKRFGALIRHYHLGFEGNVMVAWHVPQPEVERVGIYMAGYPFVSHCYERVMRPDWPYNIYTMIHGYSREEVESLVKKVSKETGIDNYRMLFSVHEWKKKSMEYIK